MKDLERMKDNYQISHIYPIKPLLVTQKKLYLFSSKKEDVDYSFYTDGTLDHIDTWIDKKPYLRDDLLAKVSKAKRFEFCLKDAHVLVEEKKIDGYQIRNLYIDEDHLFKVVTNQLYQVSINEYDHLKIKKIGARYEN